MMQVVCDAVQPNVPPTHPLAVASAGGRGANTEGLSHHVGLGSTAVILRLGCAFRRNSVEFRPKLAKSHRPERNVKVRSTGIHYNTILAIPVYSGWYLSTRLLQVENAHTYSKYVKISQNVER